MKKILILVLGMVFLLISCQNRTENILINVNYVGNYDHQMDILITNKIKKDTNIYKQRSYAVTAEKMLDKIRDYVIENHSKKTFRTNKLKVVVFVDKKEEIYYFNAKDGIKFIDYLMKNIRIKDSKTYQYQTNQYFLESELPPFKNQLKIYSGKEWMNEKSE
ncbi:hypothetical protein [Amniculibacterium sp. G2-70]|uniref:hypothetical protein n=1 Tax=Amniculibacterium sp. G2-70 TaxID=2767188 RepID=UPI0016546501|nr:hypothetical protein [Amniculibacterium sp. G2-70]